MLPADQHHDAEQVRRCLRGELVGEELTPRGREILVTSLHCAGWPDPRVAEISRMSTYVVALIRTRLGLPAHQFDAGGVR
ncbi:MULTISPECIES: hypothetical protein [unclassified Crossiella]|uniref:hypothetical protein n=1 Tax=unclassified Crossiella TaxID=2620835 RepID=UPI001FFE7E10|nr:MULTISPECIES: hypothetical protein [unclassified Crossiella]MCK2237727.1 hypothetical protein [Crossiella sp. S99.2]MCK2255013.1 hypothetical protein [Crossiella sp. S99.1]